MEYKVIQRILKSDQRISTLRRNRMTEERRDRQGRYERAGGERIFREFLERISPEYHHLAEDEYRSGRYEEGAERFIKYFQGRDPIFFIGEDRESIVRKYPEEAGETIKEGERFLQGRVSFTHPWDMERCRDEKVFKGNWKMNAGGDEEWCFMLNRHRHFQIVAKSCFLTGRSEYSEDLMELWMDWIERNPIDIDGRRTTWRRIEAGIRCENWVKSLELLMMAGTVDKRYLIRIIESLIEHGNYIAENIGSFSRTSNWGVLEFHGLYILSHYLKEFDIGGRWRTLSQRMLRECMEIQVLEDGSQWEQSPMYHNEVFHCYLNYLLISKRGGSKIEGVIWSKTRAMAEANIVWQKPNYHQPLLGDSDDTDIRDLLTLGAYLYRDGALKGRGYAEVDYENFFLLGERGCAEYRDIGEGKPEFLSSVLKDSGDIYMRSSWKEDGSWVSFHTKNLGGGHSHDNLLHISFYAAGRDYIVDPGRYTYVEEKGRRGYKIKSTHSTPRYNGMEDSPYLSVWSNTSEGKGELTGYSFGEGADICEGINLSHISCGVILRRGVIFIKPGLLIVSDYMEGRGRLEAGYHLLEGIEIEGDTVVAGNLNIQMLSAEEITGEEGSYSPEYNVSQTSHRVTGKRVIEDGGAIISLISLKDGRAEASEIEIRDRSGKRLLPETARGLRVRYRGEEYLVFARYRSLDGCFFIEGEGERFMGRYGVYKKSGKGYKKIQSM